MVVLPTGLALDDLEPAVLLARSRKELARGHLAFALCRVGESGGEIAEGGSTLARPVIA